MLNNLLNPRASWPLFASIVVALALTALPLPNLLALMRPDWIALVIIYWAMFAQRQLSLWIILLSGLALDVLYGTLLGQHALALLLMSYLPLRLYLRLRVFSWLKLCGAVAGMLFIYEFMLFWINGLSGVTTHAADYWVPVLTGTLVWPIVLVLLDGIAVRRSNTH